MLLDFEGTESNSECGPIPVIIKLHVRFTMQRDEYNDMVNSYMYSKTLVDLFHHSQVRWGNDYRGLKLGGRGIKEGLQLSSKVHSDICNQLP